MGDHERQPGDDAEQTAKPNAVTHYGVRSLRGMLGGVFERASKARPSRGVPCGNATITAAIGGFRHGRVTVLGASTSWGKSSFATMTIDVGLRVGARILLVSGEDAEDLYGQRMMCRRAGVNAMRLRDSNCTPAELSRMTAAVEDAPDEPVFMNGIGKNVEWCAKAIEHVVAEESVDLVIVDYIQAFNCAKRTQDRRNEVTFIFRTFADAIKSAGAAGLICSQLRRLEENERPTIHDLKESGDVENGAEHVLLGYRVTPKPAREGMPQPEQKRYLLVAKNKDGPALPDEPIEMPFDMLTASFREVRADGYEERRPYAD